MEVSYYFNRGTSIIPHSSSILDWDVRPFYPCDWGSPMAMETLLEQDAQHDGCLPPRWLVEDVLNIGGDSGSNRLEMVG